jgi:hypothetical protein
LTSPHSAGCWNDLRLRSRQILALFTVFGRPYVELFSRERLLSRPAHRTKELDSGGIVIQLTPELKDIETEEAAFERVRQDARNHLNNDAFFDPAKGLDHQYRVPEFTWRPILH